jgi:hypothetical protein
LFPYFRERGRTGPTCEAAAKAAGLLSSAGPMGPPGRLALRMMSPGYHFEEHFARQFALGGRYFLPGCGSPRQCVPEAVRRR